MIKVDLKKELTSSEFQKLEEHLYSIEGNINPYIAPDIFLDYTKDVLVKILSAKVKRIIRNFGRNFDNEGLLLIRNCPIDPNLLETPLDTNAPNKTTFISEAMISGIGQLIGDVFGYTNEKNGALVHNICPTLTGEKKVSSEGADLPFPFHVENLNFYPYTPTHLILFCLRNDREQKARTYLLNPKKVIWNLDNEIVNVLRKNLFSVGGNDSIGIDDAREIIMPIIRGSLANPEVTIEFKDTKPLTKEAEIALNAFKNACNLSEDIVSTNLKPGEMLIIDNRKILHSRNQFKAYYDGKDRWLQRIYVSVGNLSWNWKDKLEKGKFNIVNDQHL